MNNVLEINIHSPIGLYLITEAAKVILPDVLSNALTGKWKLSDAEPNGLRGRMAETIIQSDGLEHTLMAVLELVNPYGQFYKLKGFKFNEDSKMSTLKYSDLRTAEGEYLMLSPMEMVAFQIKFEQAIVEQTGEQYEPNIPEPKVKNPINMNSIDDDEFFDILGDFEPVVNSGEEAAKFVWNFFNDLEGYLGRRMVSKGLTELHCKDKWRTIVHLSKDDRLYVTTNRNSEYCDFNKLSYGRRVEIFMELMMLMDGYEAGQ